MLLYERLRGALLVAVAALILLAGTASADDKKDDAPKDKKEEKKKDDKDRDWMSLLDVEELMKRLPADLDEKQKQMIRQQLEAAKRQVDQAKRTVEQFRNGQLMERFVPRGRLEGRVGATFAPPSPTLAEQLELPKNVGLVVSAVRKDSPAAKAGMQTNDVLIEVNAKPVANAPEAFAKQLDSLEANKPVDVVVMRKGKKETLKGFALPEAAKVERPAEQGGSMLNLNRTGDQFTLFSREGGRIVQLRGKLSEGKAKLASAQVTDKRGSQTYLGWDKVPKEEQDEIKALLELVEKSAAKKAKE